MLETEAVPAGVQGIQSLNRSSLIIKIAIAGLLTCIGIGAIDWAILELASSNQWTGISVYLVFVVFIVQTAMLGSFVGAKIQQQPIWLVFFGWVVVLMNLALILINLGSNSYTLVFQSAFVFAFLTAQIGLVIFWGVLGSTDWRRRIPITCFLLIASGYPYWFFMGRAKQWLAVMTCYIISVFVSCVILRLWRFRLGSEDSWNATTKAGRIDQFGIKHLFIWTTIVAVLFGIGRLVPWSALATTFLNQSTVLLMARGLLMTLIIVATAWAVLGELRGAWLRVLVLVGVLSLIGYGLFYIDQRSPRSGLAGWRLNADDLKPIWFVWTTLNGLFLAGLMLVIRCSGGQLARIRKIETAK